MGYVHTKRKKRGEIKLFLLKKVFERPNFRWRTNDFLKLLKQDYNIKQRKGVNRHLKDLIRIGLLLRIDGCYSLPGDYLSIDYLKGMNKKFEGLLLPLEFYPPETFEKFYNYMRQQISKTIRVKSGKKRIKLYLGRQILLIELWLRHLATIEKYSIKFKKLSKDKPAYAMVFNGLQKYRNGLIDDINQMIENLKLKKGIELNVYGKLDFRRLPKQTRLLLQEYEKRWAHYLGKCAPSGI